MFEVRETTLKARAHATLDRLAEALLRYPEVRIELSGHIDVHGEFISRKQIGGRQADAVKAYLVSRGVAADRIETRDAGADEPITLSRNAAERAQNRRVELALLSSAYAYKQRATKCSKSTPSGGGPRD